MKIEEAIDIIDKELHKKWDKKVEKKDGMTYIHLGDEEPLNEFEKASQRCLIEVQSLNREIERLNNIINTILDFDFFKEECPLNFGYQEKCDEEKAQEVFYEDDYCEETCNDDYKKCWLKYFKRLQELKGSDKE